MKMVNLFSEEVEVKKAREQVEGSQERKEGKCRRCGRALSDPASVEQGRYNRLFKRKGGAGQ